MKAGDRVRVRAQGGCGWIDAVIILASENGRALALEALETLGVGAFAVTNERTVGILLYKDGVWWRDVASNRICEVKE